MQMPLDFSTKTLAPETAAAPCVAVGVFESRKLSAAADALDRAARGALRTVLRGGDMEGKLGATRLLYKVPS
ncbi:MAG: M17 family peptidase N-terminal domain-containing protein, partial [Burkholderiales bacterium]